RGEGLSVIDPVAGRVIGTIPIPDVNTRELSVNPARREVNVSLANGDKFYIVDVTARSVSHVVQDGVGWNSGVSVVSPDNKTVYLATSGGKDPPENKILVIDAETGTVQRVLRLGHYEFPNKLGGLVLTPDGRLIITVDMTTHQLLEVDAQNGVIRRRTQTDMTSVLGLSPAGDAFYAAKPQGLSKMQIDGWSSMWNANVVGSAVAAKSKVVAVCDNMGDR